MRALIVLVLVVFGWAMPAFAADGAAVPSVAAPAQAAAPAPDGTPPAVPSPDDPGRAFQERLAAGDRHFLAGEYRDALFAYLDAVYLDGAAPRARVRVGRVYAAMRYPERARAQYRKALELDPGFAEARRALEELDGAAAPAPGPSSQPSQPSAAQRYREGVQLAGRRAYAEAVTALDAAIAQDPRLAVAYAARASAHVGLARYREAADDYRAAIGLDPSLATPLYGLAECARQLGDPSAAELYRRYAESRAPDVREDLRALAKQRAAELPRR